jgi:DNA-binding HxlR family transcriptional regulator
MLTQQLRELERDGIVAREFTTRFRQKWSIRSQPLNKHYGR